MISVGLAQIGWILLAGGAPIVAKSDSGAGEPWSAPLDSIFSECRLLLKSCNSLPDQTFWRNFRSHTDGIKTESLEDLITGLTRLKKKLNNIILLNNADIFPATHAKAVRTINTVETVIYKAQAILKDPGEIDSRRPLPESTKFEHCRQEVTAYSQSSEWYRLNEDSSSLVVQQEFWQRFGECLEVFTKPKFYENARPILRNLTITSQDAKELFKRLSSWQFYEIFRDDPNSFSRMLLRLEDLMRNADSRDVVDIRLKLETVQLEFSNRILEWAEQLAKVLPDSGRTSDEARLNALMTRAREFLNRSDTNWKLGILDFTRRGSQSIPNGAINLPAIQTAVLKSLGERYRCELIKGNLTFPEGRRKLTQLMLGDTVGLKLDGTDRVRGPAGDSTWRRYFLAGEVLVNGDSVQLYMTLIDWDGLVLAPVSVDLPVRARHQKVDTIIQDRLVDLFAQLNGKLMAIIFKSLSLEPGLLKYVRSNDLMALILLGSKYRVAPLGSYRQGLLKEIRGISLNEIAEHPRHPNFKQEFRKYLETRFHPEAGGEAIPVYWDGKPDTVNMILMNIHFRDGANEDLILVFSVDTHPVMSISIPPTGPESISLEEYHTFTFLFVGNILDGFLMTNKIFASEATKTDTIKEGAGTSGLRFVSTGAFPAGLAQILNARQLAEHYEGDWSPGWIRARGAGLLALQFLFLFAAWNFDYQAIEKASNEALRWRAGALIGIGVTAALGSLDMWRLTRKPKR